MRIRGKWRDVEIGARKVRALATLHPAYLLRTPAAKRLAWRDLLAIKAALLDRPRSVTTHSPRYCRRMRRLTAKGNEPIRISCNSLRMPVRRAVCGLGSVVRVVYRYIRPLTVVYARGIGPYAARQPQAWRQLNAWLAQHQVRRQVKRGFGLFHDNPKSRRPSCCAMTHAWADDRPRRRP